MSPKALPTLLIIIDFCAAMGYIPSRDWHRVGYWVAAAGITYCATFGRH